MVSFQSSCGRDLRRKGTPRSWLYITRVECFFFKKTKQNKKTCSLYKMQRNSVQFFVSKSKWVLSETFDGGLCSSFKSVDTWLKVRPLVCGIRVANEGSASAELCTVSCSGEVTKYRCELRDREPKEAERSREDCDCHCDGCHHEQHHTQR